jgi:hypothetical protein
LAFSHIQNQDLASPLCVFPDYGDRVVAGQPLGIPDDEAGMGQAIEGHTVHGLRTVRACAARAVFVAIALG